MAYSTQTAVSDGTLESLPLTIEYIDRENITVIVDLNDGEGPKEYVPGTIWDWVGTEAIQFEEPLPNGAVVVLRRATEVGTLLNKFTEGAMFNAPTLDENFDQLLFLVQEAREGAGLTGVFNVLDMHGFRIQNLGDGVGDRDAANIGQVRDLVRSSPELQRTLRVAREEEPLAQLPGPEVRGGKLLAFDSAGRPTVAAPVEDSATAVRLDLADPDKGAAMVARGAVAVDSIADLLALPEGQRKEGLRYLVSSYHGGWAVENPYIGPRGGGEFVWVADTSASNNLVTAFTVPDGGGQFRRVVDGELNAFMAGARGDGVSDDTEALQRFINVGGGFVPRGYYNISQTLRIGKDRRTKFYGPTGASESPTALQWSPPFSDVVITWHGAVGGVMFDISQNGYPTPPTSYSGVGVYIGNFQLDGLHTAGFGLISVGASNTSIFENIMVRGCNTFGMIINRSWFASYRGMRAVGCKGIGIAIGFNYAGAFGDDVAVNGVELQDFRAHSCGSSIEDNPDTGYDAITRPWGGCGIYLGPGFKASTVLSRSQVEACHGNGVVIDLGSYPAPCGIRDIYLESNSGPYDFYIMGDGQSYQINPFFIENVLAARPRNEIRVYADTIQNNSVVFKGAGVVNNTGPSTVIQDSPYVMKRGHGVSSRMRGGSRVDAKYGGAWVDMNSNTNLDTAEASLLPGPVRLEMTSGPKEFDGYRFNLSPINAREVGSGSFTLLVSFFGEQWIAADLTRQAFTRSYIVNFALRTQYSTTSVSDYIITVSEIGDAANAGDSSLITDVQVSGVKISGQEAVLRATYNITNPPHNANPTQYGPRLSWSAVVLAGRTRGVVEAL